MARKLAIIVVVNVMVNEDSLIVVNVTFAIIAVALVIQLVRLEHDYMGVFSKSQNSRYHSGLAY